MENPLGLNHIARSRADFGELVAISAGAGLSGVEIRTDLGHSSPIGALDGPQARRIAETAGQRIFAINALQMCNDATATAELTRQLAELCALGREIGAEAVVLCPVNDPADTRSPVEGLSDMRRNIAAFLPVLEDYEMTGLVECLGFPESSLRSQRAVSRLIEEVGSPRMRLLFDTFHWAIGPDSFDDLAALPPEHIGLVHVSGVEASPEPAGGYRDAHRLMLSASDRLETVRQLERLAAAGYTGVVSFEPFADEVSELPAAEFTAALSESVRLVEGAFGR